MAEETAEYYLRNAVAAFDKAKAKASSTTDLKADWVEIFTLVKYAMEDIAKAKSVDPTATIDIGPTPTSPHSLAAEMLLFEGTTSTTKGLAEKTIRAGIPALKKYLGYNEDDLRASLSLTEAYINVFERDQAIDTLTSILRRDPANIDARKLRDAFKNDPQLGLAPSTTEPFHTSDPRSNQGPAPDETKARHFYSYTTEGNILGWIAIAVLSFFSLRGLVMPLRAFVIFAMYVGIILTGINILCAVIAADES